MGRPRVRVLPLWEKISGDEPGRWVVSTVSAATGWEQGLSPFMIGPCKLWRGNWSLNMENAWQYSKVYESHMVGDSVKDEWLEWAKTGWAKKRADRYPMGKGVFAKFALWNDERLDYVAARKRIYAPLYAQAVRETSAYNTLARLYRSCDELVLLDYDAYDHAAQGKTLTQVLNDPTKKMGHAFVLAMLLTDDDALSEFDRYL
jgi:hypothetical protein